MSPPLNGSFDASQFSPDQGMGKHPIGKFPATVLNTSIEETKNKDGGMLAVEFATQAGRIIKNYQLWNKSPQAVEIAQKQLSALCYATGIFKLDWPNEGAALRNGRCIIEVSYQRGQEPSQEKPDGGYVEVSRVYDANGNEPGKQVQGAQLQPQQQPNAPMQQQPNGGWGGQSTVQPITSQQAAQATGWGAPTGPGVVQSSPQAGQGWSQNSNPNQPQTPPWGQK